MPPPSAVITASTIVTASSASAAIAPSSAARASRAVDAPGGVSARRSSRGSAETLTECPAPAGVCVVRRPPARRASPGTRTRSARSIVASRVAQRPSLVGRRLRADLPAALAPASPCRARATASPCRSDGRARLSRPTPRGAARARDRSRGARGAALPHRDARIRARRDRSSPTTPRIRDARRPARVAPPRPARPLGGRETACVRPSRSSLRRSPARRRADRPDLRASHATAVRGRSARRRLRARRARRARTVGRHGDVRRSLAHRQAPA